MEKTALNPVACVTTPRQQKQGTILYEQGNNLEEQGNIFVIIPCS